MRLDNCQKSLHSDHWPRGAGNSYSRRQLLSVFFGIYSIFWTTCDWIYDHGPRRPRGGSETAHPQLRVLLLRKTPYEKHGLSRQTRWWWQMAKHVFSSCIIEYNICSTMVFDGIVRLLDMFRKYHSMFLFQLTLSNINDNMDKIASKCEKQRNERGAPRYPLYNTMLLKMR